MSDKEYALEIKNLYKHFKLPTEKASTLKGLAINRLRGIKGYKKQQVLRGIDFKVEKGEFLGIVGRNGSGKSTLLKIISEIYQPSRGKIQVNGRLVPFIELGVGFNPELTGRENVYLNGAMLGFSNTEVDAMYNEIVDFAEIHDFMDQKLKNYSSGMQVRLAFSVAIRAKSDILVLDEVLAVGDEAFQRKCYTYFAQIKKQRKTIILVTHSMDIVRQFCTRAILIDDGEIVIDGGPGRVAIAYTKLNNQSVDSAGPSNTENEYVSAKIAVSIVDSENRVYIDVDINAKKDQLDPVVAIGIYRDSGEQVYRWASDEKIGDLFDIYKEGGFRLELDNIFPRGGYTISLYIKKKDRTLDYLVLDDAASFVVKAPTHFTNDLYWHPSEKFINKEK